MPIIIGYIVITSIFVYINKDEKIVNDIGYLKIQMVLLGFLLYYLSYNFNSFENYLSCALNYTFKHIGIILIYSLFLFYISIGKVLGINYKKVKETNFESFQRYNGNNINSTFPVDNETKNDSSMKDSLKESVVTTLEEELINDIKKKLNIYNKLYKRNNSSFEIDNFSSVSINNYNTKSRKSEKPNSFYDNDYNSINSKIVKIYNCYVEYLIIFIIFIIIWVTMILINFKSEDKYIQQYDGKWRYNCPLSNANSIMDMIEFFLLIYLILKSKNLWNYIFIFKFLKRIIYSLLIWVTLGPIVNVSLYID